MRDRWKRSDGSDGPGNAGLSKQLGLSIGTTGCEKIVGGELVVNPEVQLFVIYDEDDGEWWCGPDQGTTSCIESAGLYEYNEAWRLLKSYKLNNLTCERMIKRAPKTITNEQEDEDL